MAVIQKYIKQLERIIGTNEFNKEILDADIDLKKIIVDSRLNNAFKNFFDAITVPLTESYIESLTDNELLKQLLYTYMEINDIPLEDVKEVEEQDFSSDAERQYFKDISSYPLLSKEEMYELSLAAQAGDLKARDKMVLHNLKLVIKPAYYFARRCRGAQFLDLVQEGNMGLMHAVTKYRPELGFQYSTYANWWIRMFITRYINENNDLIQIPVNLKYQQLKITTIKAEIYAKKEREATISEIAEYLGITEMEVIHAINTSGSTGSLDEDVSIDGNSTLLDIIEDTESEPIDVDVEKIFLRDDLEVFLKKHLPPREYYVIVRRYGLFGEPVCSLQTIANELNLTRSRICAIESTALRRLKSYKQTLLIKEWK